MNGSSDKNKKRIPSKAAFNYTQTYDQQLSSLAFNLQDPNLEHIQNQTKQIASPSNTIANPKHTML